MEQEHFEKLGEQISDHIRSDDIKYLILNAYINMFNAHVNRYTNMFVFMKH